MIIEIEPTFAGDYALVPEGTYEAVAVRHEKRNYFRQIKLYLWFQIINGAHQGAKVFMAFNITPRIRKSHKYYKAWVLGKGEKPKKNDRMSPKVFDGKAFLIRIKTVKYGAKQRPLPADETYSIVDEILEVSAGVSLKSATAPPLNLRNAKAFGAP